LTGDKESIRKNYSKDIEFISDTSSLKDVKEVICEIDGSWLTHIDIGNKRYWDLKEDLPSRQIPMIGNEIIPSDWRYREDLIWLSYNY